MKKILAVLAATSAAVLMVPLFAAFEAHVVNVTARIENALSVPVEPIAFGTVFPQEKLFRELPVRLAQSVFDEGRVDDVEYFIRQKPKCGVTTDNGQTLVGPTATGHVNPDGQGGYTVDCGLDPRDKDAAGNPLPIGSTWDVLPLLCPYLSKHEITEDGQELENDRSLNAFHQPFTVSTSSVDWLDTPGRLVKSAGDLFDTWLIDLVVPCFGGYCAQDWADFVRDVNPNANPDDYDQDIANEHKVFGCDLWVEVSGVSEAGDVPPNETN